MTDRVAAAFATQARACDALGSPFMGRLMGLMPQILQDTPGDVARLILGWDGDLGPSGDSVPLRLAGSLHALHLTGVDPALSAVYPPATPADPHLQAAVATALTTHSDAILRWMALPPQTNEVRRAAVLIALGHWLTARFGRPLVTSELGASAGLNLAWDYFRLDAQGLSLGPAEASVVLAPDWSGTPPVVCPAYVHDARGVDLHPLDPAQAQDALRLQAYLWPDQPDRLARTRAATAVATAPESAWSVDQACAVAWLPRRLAPRPGMCRLIYSTIAWQYIPQARRDRGAALIAKAGQAATDDSPLAWFQMEPDDQPNGAALTLRVWPGGDSLPLGRADFHGRWVDWQAPPP